MGIIRYALNEMHRLFDFGADIFADIWHRQYRSEFAIPTVGGNLLCMTDMQFVVVFTNIVHGKARDKDLRRR